jgi:hypothetical protein
MLHNSGDGCRPASDGDLLGRAWGSGVTHAAERAAPDIEADLADLASDDIERRERATARIATLGRHVVPRLEAALKDEREMDLVLRLEFLRSKLRPRWLK